MTAPFVKMNGLGNDFVIVSAPAAFDPTPDQVRAIASRDRGPGCDQIIALERSTIADVSMRIWNADGGEVAACGNATRCVAWLAMEAAGRDRIAVQTPAGILTARRAGPERVTVNMGTPGLYWRAIPLGRPMDTRAGSLGLAPPFDQPGFVSMGNPHVVFFVDDLARAPVETLGPQVEVHPLLPERANVGFAQIESRERLRLKVWERGVGQTKACGTGACAAAVAAHRRGLVKRTVMVAMDGGELLVDWREDTGQVHMTGPVAVESTGRVNWGAVH
jgi:diaminopimelate epimerase